MKKSPRTLFLELFLQQLIVAMVPFLLTIVVFVSFILPSFNRFLYENQRNLANSINNNVAAFFSNAEEQLRVFDLKSVLEDPSNLTNSLDRFVEETTVFEAIYFLDADKIIQALGVNHSLHASRSIFVGMDISRSPVLNFDFSVQEQRWSPVYQSLITNAASSALTFPMQDYIVVAEFNIDRLSDLVAELSADGTLVMIIDSSGNLIAHPDRELSKQQISMRFSPLLTDSSQQLKSGSFEWQLNRYQAVVAPVPGLGWQAVVAQPDEVFFATTRQVLVVGVLFIVVSFGLIIMVVIRSTQNLNRPIKSLQTMAVSIAQGDFSVNSVDSPIKELNQLAEQFLLMAVQLNQRAHENRLLNDQLEQRVEMRTRELADANEKLKESMQRIETTMDQLVQSEKLASLGSMVAGIAHELNTPIGNGKVAISTQIDYLRDIQKKIDQQQLTKAALDEFIGDMATTADISLRNLERAKDLISSFKQVSVDQTSSQIRDFCLLTIVSEVIVTLQPSLKKYPIVIVVDIEERIRMVSKPGPLMQVLTNLINNAMVHALREDGATLNLGISASISGRKVEVCVKDDGIGMSADHVKKAFDPFFTTKMGRGGSGLGLNIVNRMVVGALKGEVKLQSELGVGSQFTIILPIELAEAEQSERNDQSASA